jgi:gamma-glutamyltranspeptidase / glutathione hydrolase
MSPTIVLRDGRPVLALGSPGGATIITTVLQLLVEQLDRGASLPEAIAAPRVSQRNSDPGDAEPAFLASPEGMALQRPPFLEQLRPAPATGGLPSEIGAATGIAFGGHGLLQAAAEPLRRGGGSALVVHPRS